LHRTFSVGLGTPITDSFSLLVILVIAIGLGIPLLLIIGGGIFIMCKRVRGQHLRYSDISSSYAEIN